MFVKTIIVRRICPRNRSRSWLTTTTSTLSVLMLREGGNLSPWVQLEGVGDSLLGS